MDRHPRKHVNILEPTRPLHPLVPRPDETPTPILQVRPVMPVETVPYLRGDVGQEKGLVHGLLRDLYRIV